MKLMPRASAKAAMRLTQPMVLRRFTSPFRFSPLFRNTAFCNTAPPADFARGQEPAVFARPCSPQAHGQAPQHMRNPSLADGPRASVEVVADRRHRTRRESSKTVSDEEGTNPED